MADEHNLRIGVDASQGKRELDSLKASMQSVRGEISNLGNAGAFSRLSSSLASLTSGFDALKRAGSFGNLAKDIQTISTSFNNFRGPSSQAINNILRLQGVMKQLSSISVPAGLVQATHAMANLGHAANAVRVSSATVRNVQSLINLLQNGNATQVGAMTSALSRLNNINVRAPGQRAGGGGGRGNNNGHVVSNHASTNGVFSRITGDANIATGHLRGLENAFDATYQAASLFRTAIGAITLGELIHGVLDAGNAVLSFNIAMDSVATSTSEAGNHLAFVRKLAAETGGELNTMIPAYQRLASSMRSLGRSQKEAEDTFAGFQKALSANHVPMGEQTKTMRELMETFAMGGGHATQVMRGMASHIPTLAGTIQKALGINGDQLHKKFMEGGLEPEEMIKIGRALGEAYSAGVIEGLHHSQAQMQLFKNQFFELRTAIFENGFDSGLATMFERVGEALQNAGLEDLGPKIGEGFRQVFNRVTVLAEALIELRGPLAQIGTYAIAIAGLSTAFKLASMGAALLLSPLTLVSVAIVALIQNWSSFRTLVNETVDDFAVVGAAIKGIYENMGKPVGQRKSVSEAVGEAVRAETAKIEARKAGGDVGTTYADSLIADAKERLDGLLKSIGLGGASGEIEEFVRRQKETLDRLNDTNKPKPFKSTADVAQNEADEIKKRYEDSIKMKEKLEKAYDKINPEGKALHQMLDAIGKIDKMLGKQAPGDHHLITQAEVDRMKEFAKYKALEKVDPTAYKLREDMAKLDLQSKFAGNKDQLDEELKVLEHKLELKKRDLTLTKESEAALRAMIKAQQEIAKGGENGFIQWANNVKSTTDSINDNIKSGLDSFADGLTRIATEGKGKFKSLGEAIKAEFSSIFRGLASKFIKTAIEGAMKQGITGMFGQSSAVAKALGMGGDTVKKATDKLDEMVKNVVASEMNVNAAVVNINGGGGAFGAGGINPEAVGGSSKSWITGDASRAGINNFELSAKPTSLANGVQGIQAANVGAIKGIGVSGLNAFGLNGFVYGAGGEGTPGLNSMKLGEKEIKDLVKAASTEVVPGLKGEAFENQTRGVVDTILNRKASGKWGNSVADVVNAKNQFSKINGPARLNPYGSVDNMPDSAINPRVDKTVRSWIEARANGAKSSVGTHMNYGNPYYSDEKNRGWVEALQGPRYGSGNAMHYHGTTPDMEKFRPKEFTVEIEKTAEATKKLATSASSSIPDVSKVSEEIAKTGTEAMSATSGLGSLIGKLGSIGGGGGGGLFSMFGAGAFSEGGYSTEAVSSYSMPTSFWHGAPHYAEGTPNTSGGIPAVLHDNEAVIPLSRGREIPVRLEGGQGGGQGGGTVIRQTVNIQAKDHDGFRRNSNQVGSELGRLAGRALARNS